jgi:hypothetical protein
MHPVSLPNSGIGFSRKRGTLLGGLAGMLIAFALALACESRLPRVDDLEQLGEILPVPISQVSWRFLPDALAGAARLDEPHRLSWAAVGSARFGERAGAVAAEAGLSDGGRRCALLVRRGTPVVEVEEAWNGCQGAGTTVATAFLVHNELPPPWRAMEAERAAG